MRGLLLLCAASAQYSGTAIPYTSAYGAPLKVGSAPTLNIAPNFGGPALTALTQVQAQPTITTAVAMPITATAQQTTTSGYGPMATASYNPAAAFGVSTPVSLTASQQQAINFGPIVRKPVASAASSQVIVVPHQASGTATASATPVTGTEDMRRRPLFFADRLKTAISNIGNSLREVARRKVIRPASTSSSSAVTVALFNPLPSSAPTPSLSDPAAYLQQRQAQPQQQQQQQQQQLPLAPLYSQPVSSPTPTTQPLQPLYPSLTATQKQPPLQPVYALVSPPTPLTQQQPALQPLYPSQALTAPTPTQQQPPLQPLYPSQAQQQPPLQPLYPAQALTPPTPALSSPQSLSLYGKPPATASTNIYQTPPLTGGVPKVVSFDFDGTLQDISAGPNTGNPIPGTINFLKQLAAQGTKIVITTQRSADGNSGIQDFLQQNGLAPLVSGIYNSNSADKTQQLLQEGAQAHVDDRASNLDILKGTMPGLKLYLATNGVVTPYN